VRSSEEKKKVRHRERRMKTMIKREEREGEREKKRKREKREKDRVTDIIERGIEGKEEIEDYDEKRKREEET